MDKINAENRLKVLANEIAAAQFESLTNLAREIEEAGPGHYELVRGIFGLLGDKWSNLILVVLETGRLRHATLRRTLNTLEDRESISQRILTLKLRAFEHYGLIDRRVSDDVPPKVDYALTEMGAELAVHIRQVIDWINLRSL